MRSIIRAAIRLVGGPTVATGILGAVAVAGVFAFGQWRESRLTSRIAVQSAAAKKAVAEAEEWRQKSQRLEADLAAANRETAFAQQRYSDEVKRRAETMAATQQLIDSLKAENRVAAQRLGERISQIGDATDDQVAQEVSSHMKDSYPGRDTVFRLDLAAGFYQTNRAGADSILETFLRFNAAADELKRTSAQLDGVRRQLDACDRAAGACDEALLAKDRELQVQKRIDLARVEENLLLLRANGSLGKVISLQNRRRWYEKLGCAGYVLAGIGGGYVANQLIR